MNTATTIRTSIAITLAAALSLGATTPHATAQQMNIIQLFADDLGWTDLSTGLTSKGNGSLYYQTPNIDRLANEGLSFTSAYAIQNCEPTRATLFAGQYPTRTGVHNVDSLNRNNSGSLLVGINDLDGIKTDAITLGETLQAAGYTTAHVGKFHATDSTGLITSAHGFDVNIGGNTIGSPDSNYEASASGVFDDRVSSSMDAYGAPYTQAFIDEHLASHANGNNPQDILGDNKHLTDATTDAAIDFMDDHLAPDDPFFINVAYHAVHTPINNNVPRDDLKAKWDAVPTNTDPRHNDPNYAAILEGMDQSIGRIYEFIHDPNGDGDESDSIADHTMIVFVSDNGGHEGPTDNAPLKNRKGAQDEGGIRVPMIAWQPGSIAPGTVSDEAVHVVDLYPTYAEFAGAALPDEDDHAIDGESFAPIAKGETTELDRDAIYFHFPGYLEPRSRPTSTVIRDFGDDRLKVMYFYEESPHAEGVSYSSVDGAYLAFDLDADIGEANNLSDGEMDAMTFKRAARASWDMRRFLDDTEAIYPTIRSNGKRLQGPHHTPRALFKLGEDAGAAYDGNASAQLTVADITLTLNAVGSNAVLDTNATGVGVDSDLDTGDETVQRGIDGTLATPERIEFSFTEDVVLKSLLLGGISPAGTESMVLDFISGENPFIGLTGYLASQGYMISGTSLKFTKTGGGVAPLLVEFGVLDQDEVLITAGTVLGISADPATSGGILLNEIGIALPMDSVPLYFADFDGDEQLDADDIDLAFAGGFDIDLDGDGDTEDVAELVEGLLATAFGDADLNQKVDMADLDALGKAFGQSGGWANGDFDGSGDITLADLDVLGRTWGFDNTPDSGPPVFIFESVPEPASALLLLAGGLALARRRR